MNKLVGSIGQVGSYQPPRLRRRNFIMNKLIGRILLSGFSFYFIFITFIFSNIFSCVYRKTPEEGNRKNQRNFITPSIIAFLAFFLISILSLPGTLLGNEIQPIKKQPIRIIQKNSKGQTIFMIEYNLDSTGKKISGTEYMGEKDFPLIFKYDKSGRLILEKKGDEESGDIVEITDYTYNKKGILSGKVHYFVYPDGEKIIIEKLKYRYDKSGNLIYEASTSSGLETIKEYQYDNSGNRIKGIIKGEQKKPIAELHYTYTDKGLLKEVLATQPETGELIWHESYEYDGLGRLIREEHRFGEMVNKPPIIKLYQYNKKGEKTRETYMVGDQLQLEVFYEYQR